MTKLDDLISASEQAEVYSDSFIVRDNFIALANPATVLKLARGYQLAVAALRAIEERVTGPSYHMGHDIVTQADAALVAFYALEGE